MGGSRVVAGAAASCGVLNIQNQESAENDRVAPLMICVRSSFDSGAACVRLAGMRSEFRVCLSGVLQNTVPAGRFATTFMKGLSKCS